MADAPSEKIVDAAKLDSSDNTRLAYATQGRDLDGETVLTLIAAKRHSRKAFEGLVQTLHKHGYCDRHIVAAMAACPALINPLRVAP